jgi:hypothetical protein
MTADQFRQLALNLEGATEGSHQGHPDFRARGKIFATLRFPDASWGMVKLSPPDQARLVEMQPAVFVPAKGAWGRQGCTSVHLAAAKSEVLKYALDLAWQNSAAHGKKTKRAVSK